MAFGHFIAFLLVQNPNHLKLEGPRLCWGEGVKMWDVWPRPNISRLFHFISISNKIQTPHLLRWRDGMGPSANHSLPKTRGRMSTHIKCVNQISPKQDERQRGQAALPNFLTSLQPKPTAQAEIGANEEKRSPHSAQFLHLNLTKQSNIRESDENGQRPFISISSSAHSERTGIKGEELPIIPQSTDQSQN